MKIGLKIDVGVEMGKAAAAQTSTVNICILAWKVRTRVSISTARVGLQYAKTPIKLGSWEIAFPSTTPPHSGIVGGVLMPNQLDGVCFLELISSD